MITGKKGVRFVICRILLLAGYLFLFTLQFNARYFSIANNFVYGRIMQEGTPGAPEPHWGGKLSAWSTAIPQTAAIQKQAAHVQYRTHNPSHLGIDKRFHFKQAIRVPEIRGPGLLFYTRIASFHSNYSSDYSSSHLPVNALRGPPRFHYLRYC